MRVMRKANFFVRAIAWIFPCLYRIYMGFVFFTSRRIFYNFDELIALNKRGANILAAAWHQDAVFGVYAFRDNSIVTMVSKSDFGELMARIIKRIGYIPIRGGSSMGGSGALSEVIEYFHGHDRIICALAADGSRGPSRKVKKGILVIAKETGAPIFPVRTGAKRRLLLRTWDRTLIPLPFNILVYFCGTPIYVPRDADLGIMEEKRQELEDKLMDLVERSDTYFAGNPQRENSDESKLVQHGTGNLWNHA